MARRNPLNPLSLLFVLCVLVYSFYTDYLSTRSDEGASRTDSSVQAGDPTSGATSPPSESADQAIIAGLIGQVVTGRVTGIVDGDTLDLQIDPRRAAGGSAESAAASEAESSAVESRRLVTVRLRLEGVDAPEADQAFGSAATSFLRQLCEGQVVFAVFQEVDRFGRVVGDLYREDLWINGQMVRAGLAWQDPRFASHAELASLEQAARTERRGLWQDGSSIPPWQYRRQLEATSSSR